jgi:hypothetical protein
MSQIVVRPLDPRIEGEEPYVLATSVDAIVATHGGRSARRDMFRELVVSTVMRSNVEIAHFDDDAEVIWGFAAWSPDRVLELFYLRQRMLERDPGTGYSKPKELAFDVTRAMLGENRVVRMRRLPLQHWVFGVVHQAGYHPSIMPENL